MSIKMIDLSRAEVMDDCPGCWQNFMGYAYDLWEKKYGKLNQDTLEHESWPNFAREMLKEYGAYTTDGFWTHDRIPEDDIITFETPEHLSFFILKWS